jgi:hypothetical protein
MMNSRTAACKLIAGGAGCNGRFWDGRRNHGLEDVPDPGERVGNGMVAANDPLSPREALLAAAARAVVAAFRDQLEQRMLAPPARAALLLLESALDPYFPPPEGS